MKILFQGDSITDAGRNREDCHNLGDGYPKYAAEQIQKMFPDTQFEFINLGISGNQTKDMIERIDTDIVDVNPDIISVLVGINDVWHHSEGWAVISDEDFENRYRTILSAIKEKTKARLVMIEPFLLPTQDKYFYPTLETKIRVVRKLAREYADIYIPLDGILEAQLINGKIQSSDYATDGVHPTPLGAEFVGSIYAQYVKNLIEKLK